MTAELSDFDRRLLDAVQRGVPLLPRPWGQLAAELGAAEGAVIARVAALSGGEGILREVTAFFDAAALGYATTLVAARCAPDALDAAAPAAAEHPGVSHCYGRDAELNLWFTLAVGPDSALGLDATLRALRRIIRAGRLISLPAVRRYKLHVRFDLAEQAGAPAPRPGRVSQAGASSPAVTPDQVQAIRALQAPLPAAPRPFDQLARAAGMSGDDLLVHAADFLAAGWMRRYAGVLRHRQAGAAANALVAWQVPEDDADRFGRRAAGFGAVSHCYLRRTGPGWPYNLYTMVHGPDEGEVGGTIGALAAAGGDYPRAVLPTAREYKKARVRLFSPAVARWEAAVAD